MSLRRPPRLDAAITLVALLLLVLWEASGLDLKLIRQFGNAQGFAWRDAWFTSRLLHDGGRWLAALALLGLVLGALWPGLAAPLRRRRLFWLGATLAALVLVPLMKHFSSTSCPWSLTEFGGVAAYVPHWLPGRLDGGPGGCFPSGHAVSAFGFFSLYFLWREHRPNRARWALVAVLVIGALFGWAQMVRGAHYASHAMWSAWLCWAWFAGCDGLVRQRLRAERLSGQTGARGPSPA